jgi:glycosyltransferase involved in cell wall biosynthesis
VSAVIDGDEYEIIIVNDGSYDNSLEEIQKFASTMSKKKLRIVTTSNNGSASARNLAMSLAKGKWILFLDSDDVLNNEVLNRTYKELSKIQMDVQAINYEFSDSHGSHPRKSVERDKESLLRQGGYWRYIYRKQFIVDHKVKFLPTFEEVGGLYILDDWYFLLAFLNISNNIIFKEETIYHYNSHVYDRKGEERYRRQINLEPKALRVFYKSSNKRKFFRNRFIMNAVYNRVHMICRNTKFLKDVPSRVLLLLVYLEIAILNDSRRVLSRFFRLSLQIAKVTLKILLSRINSRKLVEE